MRNVMKRRRRLGVVNPYAAILATEPDLFVGLEYAVIGSQQVLWQDAAGTTTPVTALDDPIGCVRHPITGAIVASQSTTSARPLWKGSGVGAFFDGVDDHMVAPAAMATSQSIYHTFAVAKGNSSVANKRIISYATNNGVAQTFLRVNGDDRQQGLSRGSTAGGDSVSVVGDVSAGAAYLFEIRVNASPGLVEIARNNGVFSSAEKGSAFTLAAHDRTVIGAMITLSTPEQFFPGSIGLLIGYAASMSDAHRSDIFSNLHPRFSL